MIGAMRLPLGIDSFDRALAGGLALGRVHLLSRGDADSWRGKRIYHRASLHVARLFICEKTNQ